MSSSVTLVPSRSPPHSARRLLVTIKVPPHASAGERYAMLWAQVTAPKQSPHTVTMVNRVGIRVYLHVGPGGEPASDFRIETLTPQRARNGDLAFITEVRNTGRRALDMNGTLTLSETSGALRAGPFRATPGTTLAPGQAGSVTIALDRRLPPGPWQAHLTMNSGRVRRSATASVTLPAQGTGAPTRPDTSRFTGLLLLILGSAATLAVVLFAFGRRHRSHVIL